MTARQKALAAASDKVQGAPKIKKWTAGQEDLVTEVRKMQWVHHRQNKSNCISRS